MNNAFKSKSKSFERKLVMVGILAYVNNNLPESLKATKVSRVYNAQREKTNTIVVDVKRN